MSPDEVEYVTAVRDGDRKAEFAAAKKLAENPPDWTTAHIEQKNGSRVTVSLVDEWIRDLRLLGVAARGKTK